MKYQSGFGNEFATEAVAGALPEGQNSPQRAPLGLYTEQISGTPFTAPRHLNRRTWTYRIRPSVMHKPFQELPRHLLRSGPFDEVATSPNQLRWDPLPIPVQPADFVEGLVTLAGCGDPAAHSGIGIHVYAANRELLIVPQMGALRIHTELGTLDVSPLDICLIPRGIKFQVDLLYGEARGYVCENYGAIFRLPDLGPIGANGLANPRDFLTPLAAFEDREGGCQVIAKFLGKLWSAEVDHSPLDVVAWQLHQLCDIRSSRPIHLHGSDLTDGAGRHGKL